MGVRNKLRLWPLTSFERRYWWEDDVEPFWARKHAALWKDKWEEQIKILTFDPVRVLLIRETHQPGMRLRGHKEWANQKKEFEKKKTTIHQALLIRQRGWFKVGQEGRGLLWRDTWWGKASQSEMKSGLYFVLFNNKQQFWQILVDFRQKSIKASML